MLGRHGLHHIIRQGCVQRHHGGGVAGERARGEGINLEKGKLHDGAT